MKIPKISTIVGLSERIQLLAVVLVVLVAASGCYFLVPVIGYRSVALVLLLVVSVQAMVFTIRPILVSATLSAVVWNYFFIPPIFTFRISNTEDVLLFLMYFIIALLNAVLGSRIRKLEHKASLEAEKAKTILLYDTLFNSLSHELKTPIATILASTDVLKNNATKLTDAHKQELYLELELAGERLNKQINNLLQMSRAESGTLHPKPQWTDIGEYINTIIGQHYYTSKHRISIHLPTNFPFVKVDTGLLTPVLTNLVDNALLYASSPSMVQLAFSWQKGELSIAIADNGPGFPANEIEKVFEKFYRLPNTQQKGTGLGLSIVRGLLTVLGGKVVLKANIPKGAVFEITLPAECSTINLLNNE